MTDGNEPRDGDERTEKGKVVSFGGRGRRREDERSADVIPIAAPRNGEPLPVTFSDAPLRIIALAAVLVMLYFGRLVIIPVLIAILFAFMLAPLVSVLERKRVPRALGSGVAVVLLGALLYVGSYFFYLRAVEFMGELPKYSRQIRDATLKYRRQAEVIQQTREVIAPTSPDERRAVPVKTVEATDPATQGAIAWMDVIIAASFIPFLAYFMLSWQGHVHRATVQLFAPEHRTNAYVTISNMGRMMRAFLVGNLVVGMILGAASSAIFWWLGVPYFYFVGFISGFVSLVPYLGVVLALAPPLMVGISTVPAEKLTLLAVAVVVLHLIGVNVLYPKVLGRHLQLNPLAVTVGLLFFWFLWGGMGLVLAVPVTAAIKIICDHVPELNEWGFWLSEGETERSG